MLSTSSSGPAQQGSDISFLLEDPILVRIPFAKMMYKRLISVPGLLAGLHEFPTRSNVTDLASLKPSGMQSIAQETIKDTLVTSVSPFKALDSLGAKTKASAATPPSELRISKIKNAGDVLHIFSHIRKTYRVQWILLEGGSSSPEDIESEEPPQLSTDYAFPTALPDEDQEKPVNTKAKKKGKQLGRQENSNTLPVLRWVGYEDVQHASESFPVHSLTDLISDVSCIASGQAF